jgi:F0F1-type ATP synthase gamma subunit
MSTSPYCFHCKEIVSDFHQIGGPQKVEFTSKKNQKVMIRTAIKGTCGKCNKNVSKFIKSEVPENVPPPVQDQH